MKKSILILFFLILLCSFTFAQPPFQTSSGDSDPGVEIVFPKIEYFEIDKMIEFHFHIHNSTEFILNDSQVDCIIHIYDKANSHILIDNLTQDANGIDLKVSIPQGTFSYHGSYSYLVYCNSSQNEAGFVSNPFHVNSNGEDPHTDSALAIILVFIIINGFLFFLGLRKEDYVTNSTRETNELVNFIIKRGILIVATYLLVLNMGIFSSIVESSHFDILNEVFRYMFVFGYVGYIMLITLVTNTIFKTMKLYKIKKQNERFK